LKQTVTDIDVTRRSNTFAYQTTSWIKSRSSRHSSNSKDNSKINKATLVARGVEWVDVEITTEEEAIGEAGEV
jgi:hypothetical protein